MRGLFVPSHGSWRISLILANDLAKRKLIRQEPVVSRATIDVVCQPSRLKTCRKLSYGAYAPAGSFRAQRASLRT